VLDAAWLAVVNTRGVDDDVIPTEVIDPFGIPTEVIDPFGESPRLDDAG
jgi:hypothetical protein